MRKIERLSLEDVKRLRIDVAENVNLKATFLNRLKFLLFDGHCSFRYMEINGGIKSGWIEQ